MVDARGLLCPMPVVMVQKEVKTTGAAKIEVLVDDPCAVENISRFAYNNGYKTAVEENGSEWKLTLTK